jgi:hypothetical protein
MGIFHGIWTLTVGYVNEAIYVTIYVVVKPKLKNSSEETLVWLRKVYNWKHPPNRWRS